MQLMLNLVMSRNEMRSKSFGSVSVFDSQRVDETGSMWDNLGDRTDSVIERGKYNRFTVATRAKASLSEPADQYSRLVSSRPAIWLYDAQLFSGRSFSSTLRATKAIYGQDLLSYECQVRVYVPGIAIL